MIKNLRKQEEDTDVSSQGRKFTALSELFLIVKIEIS